jgi:hypothetical protein
MPSVTSFKALHVYNLRKPLDPSGTLKYALLVTSGEYVHRREHQIVSVLILGDRPSDRAESYIRVKIHCRDSGGTAHLAMNYYGAVDNIMPMPKSNLMVTSAKQITPAEEEDVRAKLKDWLGL